jgi:hypothetical protein
MLSAFSKTFNNQILISKIYKLVIEIFFSSKSCNKRQVRAIRVLIYGNSLQVFEAISN